MSWLTGFLSSTIGAKFLVALTGAALFLFLIAHMLGNLQIFLGPDAINSYATALRKVPELLWGARLGLLAAVVIHIGLTIKLTRQNSAARPIAYEVKEPVDSTLASRTMILTGLLVLAFIVYHLLQFTLGVTNPDQFAVHDAQGRHDVYRMVILGFQQPAVVLSYLVAQVLLGFHLSHGIGSLFQTLGLNNPKIAKGTRLFGQVSAIVIVTGFLSVPFAVITGILHLP
jgi:succinate dehydrogenase / fumarate reductase cytochrome b subunit